MKRFVVELESNSIMLSLSSSASVKSRGYSRCPFVEPVFGNLLQETVSPFAYL